MTVNASRARPRRTTVGTEEERAWVSFYQRVGKDPAIAIEVLAQLDADAEMKREHLALYLCCRESLRLHHAREVRNQRIGRFVRWLFGGLFIRLPSALRRAVGRGSDLAAECLPEVPAEPATAQVQRLSADPKVRSKRARFAAQAEPTMPSTAGAAPSAAEAPPQAARAGG